MVTESVSESIYRPNYFPLPPSPISTEQDEVLDNLVDVLNTTLTHPDEAVQLIARKALDEVRRVQEQARRKLADQQAGLSARRLELLIYEIARVLQIDADKLKSRRRTQHVAFQRQIAMYLLRRVSGTSFPTIGEHFHRNHSTVIYAVALIERRMERDAAFRQFVEELEAQITGQPQLRIGSTAEPPGLSLMGTVLAISELSTPTSTTIKRHSARASRTCKAV
jgi:Bacterial dnaA protein helix-turn-helix